MATDPAIYQELRSQVLSLSPAEVGLSRSADHPYLWGVVVDTTNATGSWTLVALVDGTTSLYLSSGGGTIGAGEHALVAGATDRLLTVAERYLGSFHLAGTTAVPPVGETQVVALGWYDTRAERAAESEFVERRHPISNVFWAAQEVITEIRLLSAPEPNRVAYRQPDGTTRLMAAALSGALDTISRVLDLGHPIDEPDDTGQTALMYASNGGKVRAVELLLQRGANVRAADRQGNEPVMFAAQHGYVEIIQRLLQAGADPNARGTHGLTALGLARQNNHTRAVTILAAAGATA